MSIFSSKFDLVTEETHAAPTAFAVMLDVARSGASFSGTGTWNPGDLTAGSVVMIDSSGKAVPAVHPASGAAPVMPLVVIDGTDTFSGAFTSKVTCLVSGFQMKTDQFVSADVSAFTKGAPVSFANGKVAKWESGKQVLGFVGVDGYDSAKGQLHVVVLPRV